jgi:hypothetical protein
MIVPMLHTKGITAYALAIQNQLALKNDDMLLTLVRRVLDQLADHGLNHSDVAVQCTTDKTASEGNPDVRSKPDS